MNKSLQIEFFSMNFNLTLLATDQWSIIRSWTVIKIDDYHPQIKISPYQSMIENFAPYWFWVKKFLKKNNRHRLEKYCFLFDLAPINRQADNLLYRIVTYVALYACAQWWDQVHTICIYVLVSGNTDSYLFEILAGISNVSHL